jgi:hypothetical protein
MLRPIAPIIDYVVNQDYIAEFLCINKDKPELECNGKCHLKKELQKTQEDTQQSFNVNLEDYPISPLHSLLSELPSKLTILQLRKVTNYYTEKYIYLFSTDIFHPPQL